MATVIVVLHGGLGNQLFQLFKASTLAARLGANLRIFADVLDRYGMPRAMEIGPLLDDPVGQLRMPMAAWALARARLPKILARLSGREPVVSVGSWKIVDGYFQSASVAKAVGPCAAAELFERWRPALGIDGDQPDGVLEHIRLRDFFETGDAARAHAEARVAAAGPAAFMTDDDQILAPILSRNERSADLLQTGGWTGLEGLARMAKFGTIRTNGSTLALWAALLGGGRLVTSVAEHAAFANALRAGCAQVEQL